MEIKSSEQIGSPDSLMGKVVPFCSIVIPNYNAAATLELCLESIKRLTYPKDRYEVIIVDNGSIDNSLDIVSTYNVRILEEKSMQSSYAARNAGIRASRGDLIAFTDADCIVAPEWLSILTEHWNSKEYGCFAGEIETYEPETLVEIFSDRIGLLGQKTTLGNSYMPYPQTANAAYRKNVFDKIGLFVPEMTSGGDAYIAWKMQQQLGLKIKYLPRAIVYHKHRSSIEGLYQQSAKYEYGKYYWTKYYRDYPFPLAEERRQNLERSIREYCTHLRRNLGSLLNERIDFVSFMTPFLEMIMCAGAYKARLDIAKSSNDSICTDWDEGKTGKINEYVQSPIIPDDITAKELRSLLVQKDALISSILNSKSWKLTAPLRKFAGLFRPK